MTIERPIRFATVWSEPGSGTEVELTISGKGLLQSQAALISFVKAGGTEL